MIVKRRRWGSLTERNGKWVVRWQENGRRRQKGGFASRSVADRFLQDKELEFFRVGFVPDPHTLGNAMEISIEAIDTMRCPEGDAEPEQPTETAGATEVDDAVEAVEELSPIELDRVEAGDMITIELADRPRRVRGTVNEVDRDADHRVCALKISVRLAANQIVGVLGRKKQSDPVGS